MEEGVERSTTLSMSQSRVLTNLEAWAGFRYLQVAELKARRGPMSCFVRGVARKEVRRGKGGMQAEVGVGIGQGAAVGGASGVARWVVGEGEEEMLTRIGELTSLTAAARGLE